MSNSVIKEFVIHKFSTLCVSLLNIIQRLCQLCFSFHIDLCFLVNIMFHPVDNLVNTLVFNLVNRWLIIAVGPLDN